MTERSPSANRPCVLVSACLLGERVRYDGGHQRAASDILQRWLAEGRVVAVCPEIAGGLPVPRAPAEIVAPAGAADVLAGRGRVIDCHGRDVTAAFVAGADAALRLARAREIRLAVLKEGSPSCGSHRIYDGRFSGTRIPGQGLTASRLAAAGLQIFNEDAWDAADRALDKLAIAHSSTDLAP